LSTKCQKVVKIVKKMSKSCQKVVKSSLNNIGKTIGQTLKTKTGKPGKFERMV
jgi:hypothetical protein